MTEHGGKILPTDSKIRCRFDGLAHATDLVGGHVVHDHDDAGRESRQKRLAQLGRNQLAAAGEVGEEPGREMALPVRRRARSTAPSW